MNETTQKALISTWEEACAQKGLDPVTCLPDVSAFPERHQRALIATAKLYIIAEVLNDGWIPNWDDAEWKYWPWFDMDSPGFRFYVSDYVSGYSSSAVGSRLCFKSEKLSDYAGKTFVGLFRDAMTLG